MAASPYLTRERAQNPAMSHPKAGCQESHSLFSSVKCSMCVISVCPGNIHVFMLSACPVFVYVHGNIYAFGE